MPTYEYVCEKCGHRFEVFQSMNDKPLAVCPQNVCPQKKWGKGKVKKQIGAGAGLIFKGSGFYITDYRSEKYKESAKKEAPAASGSTSAASASGSGSDSKPSGGSSTTGKSNSKPPAKPTGKG